MKKVATAARIIQVTHKPKAGTGCWWNSRCGCGVRPTVGFCYHIILGWRNSKWKVVVYRAFKALKKGLLGVNGCRSACHDKQEGNN